MSKKKDEEINFKAQSYLRLLKFSAPYWKRLTFGILCGMLVGGSLFVALLLIPQMIGLVPSMPILGPICVAILYIPNMIDSMLCLRFGLIFPEYIAIQANISDISPVVVHKISSLLIPSFLP